jgi:hypothetical protein
MRRPTTVGRRPRTMVSASGSSGNGAGYARCRRPTTTPSSLLVVETIMCPVLGSVRASRCPS